MVSSSRSWIGQSPSGADQPIDLVSDREEIEPGLVLRYMVAPGDGRHRAGFEGRLERQVGHKSRRGVEMVSPAGIHQQQPAAIGFDAQVHAGAIGPIFALEVIDPRGPREGFQGRLARASRLAAGR